MSDQQTRLALAYVIDAVQDLIRGCHESAQEDLDEAVRVLKDQGQLPPEEQA